MKRNQRLMLQEIAWAIAAGAQLTEWEQDFVHSMHRCAVSDTDLTDKQEGALTRVWKRVYKKQKDNEASYL